MYKETNNIHIFVCLQDSCEMDVGFFAVRKYEIEITAPNLKVLTLQAT